MRKLKFRFWKDKEIQGVLELKTNNILDMAWEWDSVDQFTGLFDKQGKEIYEGDIVRCYDHFEDDPRDPELDEYTIKQVRWLGEQGYPGFDVEPASEYLEWNNLQNYAHVQENGEKIEVIGNIYENPELLK